MRLLADLHISPATVSFLRSLGHDILRVTAALPPTADDTEIIAYAAQENRTIITQDLDFSASVDAKQGTVFNFPQTFLVPNRIC
jgi:predicted nuclease of predicted toxin-antitoxin system